MRLNRPRKRVAALVESLEGRTLLAGNPTVIDLLVVYTPAAKADAGSDAAIQGLIRESVNATNHAFLNSQINAVARLVHAEEIAYASNGNNSEDLNRLRAPADGYMDSVYALRDAWGADLVSLISTGAGGGIANLLHDVNFPSPSALAFSVIDINSMNPGNLTMTHELGHNLGGGHERGNTADPAVGPFPYSYGHRFTANGVVYHDIMSYDPGIEVPYFANPLVSYKGTPTGSAAGNADSADLAATFAQTIPLVANYRSTVVADTAAPTATLYEMRRSGNVLDFTVRYQDETAVDASSLDASDVGVTAPGGVSLSVGFVAVDSTDNAFARKATYRVTLPGSVSSLASLQFDLKAGQVKDINNNAAAASVIPLRGGDTAMLSMAAARELGALTGSVSLSESVDPRDYYDFYAFTLALPSDVTLTMSALNDDFNVYLFQDINGNGTHDWATENLGNTFGSADGAVTRSLYPGTYYALVINPPSQGVGNYTLSIDVLPDLAAPTATLHEMRRSGNNLDFVIRYEDQFAVDASSLDAFDVRVTAPGGLSLPVELVSVDSTNNGPTRKATYRTVLPPSVSSLASLQFDLQAGQVRDINNNTVGALTIPIRGGDSAMNAMADARDLGELAPNVTLSDSTAPNDYTDFYSFTLNSTLNVAMSMTGLSHDLNASLVYDFNGNGEMDWPSERIEGTYHPDTAADRAIVTELTPGTYYVVVFAPQDGVSTGLYTLSLDAYSSASDVTPPTATLDIVDVTSPVPYFDFAVTYSDDNWLDGELTRYYSGIRFEDQFGGWFYDYPDSNLNLAGWPDVRSRTIYYRIGNVWNPGENWTSADNGLYTVKIQPASPRVADRSGNVIPLLTLGTFRIAIGQADTTNPTATLGPLAPVDAGADMYEFTVTYKDNRAVNEMTLDNSDMRVTGPNGFDQLAQFISVSAAPTIGSARVATYRITAPGGAWDSTDNGAYSIALQASQVLDTASRAVAASTLGTLNVAINHFTSTAAGQVTLTLGALGTVTLDSFAGKTYFLVGDQLAYVVGSPPRTHISTAFRSPVRVTSDIIASFAAAAPPNVSVLRNAVLTLDADSHIDDLTLDPGATLNLSNKALAIRTHGGNVSSVLDKLNGYLRAARNNGAWNLPGITGAGATNILSPALIPNRTSFGAQLKSAFAGATVDADSLLLKLSPTGDANLSGTIDIDDYFLIDLAYALGLTGGYHQGNFNYSLAGAPAADDYFLIDASFIAQGPLTSDRPTDLFGDEEITLF